MGFRGSWNEEASEELQNEGLNWIKLILTDAMLTGEPFCRLSVKMIVEIRNSEGIRKPSINTVVSMPFTLILG